jgi:hypothetical protein
MERIATGEQLRAVIQGRSTGWDATSAPCADATLLLRDIRAGRTDGPVPFLGATYRSRWREERAIVGQLETALQGHPTWPWLSRIRGVGPRAAGRLLSRLDIERAPSPSSFWSYCGLHTVPGQRFECEQCGADFTLPVGSVVRRHVRLRTQAPCGGRVSPVTTLPAIRVAPIRAPRGRARSFDESARVACYLLGVGLIAQGRSYRAFYDEERTRFAAGRDWSRAHVHRAAARMMVKLFLVHLWSAWRSARDGAASAAPHGGLAARPRHDPWLMADR